MAVHREAGAAQRAKCSSSGKETPVGKEVGLADLTKLLNASSSGLVHSVGSILSLQP